MTQSEVMKRKYHGCEIVTTVTHTFAPDSHEVSFGGESIGVFPMLAQAVACAKQKNPPPLIGDSIVEESEDAELDTDIYDDEEDFDD